jgi:hypothetical protein
MGDGAGALGDSGGKSVKPSQEAIWKDHFSTQGVTPAQFSDFIAQQTGKSVAETGITPERVQEWSNGVRAMTIREIDIVLPYMMAMNKDPLELEILRENMIHAAGGVRKKWAAKVTANEPEATRPPIRIKGKSSPVVSAQDLKKELGELLSQYRTNIKATKKERESRQAYLGPDGKSFPGPGEPDLTREDVLQRLQKAKVELPPEPLKFLALVEFGQADIKRDLLNSWVEVLKLEPAQTAKINTVYRKLGKVRKQDQWFASEPYKGAYR